MALQGKLEMEIAQLPPEDVTIFMQEYGIEELSLSKMIRLSYDLMQVQTFFTVGDEVRAWETKWRASSRNLRVRSIPTCSAASSGRRWWLARISPHLGGMNEAKSKGKLRLEGKEYIVKEGDIVHIRSSL